MIDEYNSHNKLDTFGCKGKSLLIPRKAKGRDDRCFKYIYNNSTSCPFYSGVDTKTSKKVTVKKNMSGMEKQNRNGELLSM